MFLTLHQKFANMSPNCFDPDEGPLTDGVLDVAACVPPPAFPRTNRSGALRRAPARSVLVVSEFAPLATTARASRQSSVNCAAFPQGQQTVVRRPHPKDPREAPPCPMLSHDRVGGASGFLGISPSDCLLIRSPPKYHCEIDSRHASLAVFRAFAKNRPTQARRTNTLPAHLPCSYEASFTARSPALSRPPPAFGRCARRLSVLPRCPPAPRAFPWSRTRRADCLFFLRAVVGWISLARAGVARRASSTIVFAAPSRGWFLSPPRSVGSLAARVASRAATAPGAPRRGPIIPRERRLFRSRLVLPVPDRRSGFCRALVAAIENRRAQGGSISAVVYEDSRTRTRRGARTRTADARSLRAPVEPFSLGKISGTRRELSFLFFTGRCPFPVRRHLARGSFSEILSRPIDRAR